MSKKRRRREADLDALIDRARKSYRVTHQPIFNSGKGLAALYERAGVSRPVDVDEPGEER